MARAKKSKSKRSRKAAAPRAKAVKKKARKASRKKLIPPPPKVTSFGASPKGTSFGARTIEIHNEHADNRPWVLDTQKKQVEKIIAAVKRGVVSERRVLRFEDEAAACR